MSDDDKTRKVESTEYDKFMLSLESIAKNVKKHIKM